MLRHFSRNVFFFQIFELGNIFENYDQKVPKNAKKVIFWQKIMFLDFFGQNFQKYCPIQKFEKKKEKSKKKASLDRQF